MASAMPLVPLGQTSNVESVALVCGRTGVSAPRPAIRYGGYGVRRYGYGHRYHGGYRSAYGYHRGYRRY